MAPVIDLQDCIRSLLSRVVTHGWKVSPPSHRKEQHGPIPNAPIPGADLDLTILYYSLALRFIYALGKTFLEHVWFSPRRQRLLARKVASKSPELTPKDLPVWSGRGVYTTTDDRVLWNSLCKQYLKTLCKYEGR